MFALAPPPVIGLSFCQDRTPVLSLARWSAEACVCVERFASSLSLARADAERPWAQRVSLFFFSFCHKKKKGWEEFSPTVCLRGYEAPPNVPCVLVVPCTPFFFPHTAKGQGCLFFFETFFFDRPHALCRICPPPSTSPDHGASGGCVGTCCFVCFLGLSVSAGALPLAKKGSLLLPNERVHLFFFYSPWFLFFSSPPLLLKGGRGGRDQYAQHHSRKKNKNKIKRGWFSCSAFVRVHACVCVWESLPPTRVPPHKVRAPPRLPG